MDLQHFNLIHFNLDLQKVNLMHFILELLHLNFIHFSLTHCWLPTKVMYPANSTKRFSWLTRSTSILLMKNVQIYILTWNYSNLVHSNPF